MTSFTTNESEWLRAVGPVFIAFLLSACSSSLEQIHPEYVSPDKYQGLSCQEIGTDGERVARRVAEISGVEYTSGATVLGAPPIVVRWPTPSLATSQEGTAELAKLKGEFEALEQAAERKRCGLSFKQQAG